MSTLPSHNALGVNGICHRVLLQISTAMPYPKVKSKESASCAILQIMLFVALPVSVFKVAQLETITLPPLLQLVQTIHMTMNITTVMPIIWVCTVLREEQHTIHTTMVTVIAMAPARTPLRKEQQTIHTTMGTVIATLVRILLREENQTMHMAMVTVMRMVAPTLLSKEPHMKMGTVITMALVPTLLKEDNQTIHRMMVTVMKMVVRTLPREQQTILVMIVMIKTIPPPLSQPPLLPALLRSALLEILLSKIKLATLQSLLSLALSSTHLLSPRPRLSNVVRFYPRRLPPILLP